MFLHKFSVVILVFLLALSFPFGTVSAMEIPQFPSCTNPQGELKASYDTGIHGVPGDSNAYTGSDHVYTLNNEQTLQCLCAESGNGIQTDWLKVGQLSEEMQKSYETQGYTYIPNGAAWGLQHTGYIAKNSPYSCGGSGSHQGGSDGRSDGRSDGLSDGRGGGSIQASVLGLASTGDVTSLLGFFFLGLTALVLGVTLKKKE